MVDDEQVCARCHGAAAGLQDASGVRVVPVVEDQPEYVGVAAGGHRLEEVARDDGASIGHSPLTKKLVRSFETARLVEQHRTQARMRGENRGDEAATAAADVDNRLGGREVKRVKKLG